MAVNQKVEPEDGRILHGAGQSPETFNRYWDNMGVYKPLIYMYYMQINNIQNKLIKLKKEIVKYPGIFLQIGLNFKVKGEGEKLHEVTLGNYDSQIEEFISFARDFKKPIFLRLGYEFNEPGKYNPEKYILA